MPLEACTTKTETFQGEVLVSKHSSNVRRHKHREGIEYKNKQMHRLKGKQLDRKTNQ